MPSSKSGNNIGTLNEKSLHASLKDHYAQIGDKFEVNLDGYVIDIIREDLLIEIQTRSFFALKKKLKKLSKDHKILLIHPIAEKKWIVKQDDDGNQLDKRKSPKRGDYYQVFNELINFPDLLESGNIRLELLLFHEEEVRRYDKRKSWRRKGWYTYERRLIEVNESKLFKTSKELVELLPATLNEPFTTRDISDELNKTMRESQKIAYSLNKMGATKRVGKDGNSILYEVVV